MNFKLLRQRLNISVTDIATKLNISESTYRKYEISVLLPQAETILKMQNIFKCTSDEILNALNYHVNTKVTY